MKIQPIKYTSTSIDIDQLHDSQLLDPFQAANVLQVRDTTLTVWRSTGRVSLPFVKVGRSVRYRAGDLKEFIARRTRTLSCETA